jgi:hypothetical protein
VGEIADQLAVRFALIEHPLLAGDLELLLGVPEFEQKSRHFRVRLELHRRNGARQVHDRVAVRRKRETVLRVATVVVARVAHRCSEDEALLEHGFEMSAFGVAMRESEEVLRGRIHVAHEARVVHQYDCRGEKVETGKGAGRHRRMHSDDGFSKNYATSVT